MLLFSLIITCFLSCEQKKQPNTSNSVKIESKIKIEPNAYQPTSIPLFFENLVTNHIKNYTLKDSMPYKAFCLESVIDENDSANVKTYYTFRILHELLTSQNASNCSVGKILNIPYFWHWTNPNPRHDIYTVENHTLLKDIKPPQKWAKYKSLADIDRTPYLYLSDLMSENPQYYTPTCDTFSTFGWCSEREMAFVCLFESLNYHGKVIAEGNHSWSEFIVPLKVKGVSKTFVVKVDNTFNRIAWTAISSQDIEKWEKYQSSVPLSSWYNEKAHSQKEQQGLKNFIASKKAMARVETRLINYLNKME